MTVKKSKPSKDKEELWTEGGEFRFETPKADGRRATLASGFIRSPINTRKRVTLLPTEIRKASKVVQANYASKSIRRSNRATNFTPLLGLDSIEPDGANSAKDPVNRRKTLATKTQTVIIMRTPTRQEMPSIINLCDADILGEEKKPCLLESLELVPTVNFSRVQQHEGQNGVTAPSRRNDEIPDRDSLIKTEQNIHKSWQLCIPSSAKLPNLSTNLDQEKLCLEDDNSKKTSSKKRGRKSLSSTQKDTLTSEEHAKNSWQDIIPHSVNLPNSTVQLSEAEESTLRVSEVFSLNSEFIAEQLNTTDNHGTPKDVSVKKRGRPRTSSLHKASESAKVLGASKKSEEEGAESHVTLKKRGRPRSSLIHKESESIEVLDTSIRLDKVEAESNITLQTQSVKKRGRPRTLSVNKGPEASEDTGRSIKIEKDDTDNYTIIKTHSVKKRGRPRTSSVHKEPETIEVLDASINLTKMGTESHSSVKKRGRPRTSSVNKGPEAIEDSNASLKIDEADTENHVTLKSNSVKKRGRPRTPSMQSDPKMTVVLNPNINLSDVGTECLTTLKTQSMKKRGRPRTSSVHKESESLEVSDVSVNISGIHTDHCVTLEDHSVKKMDRKSESPLSYPLIWKGKTKKWQECIPDSAKFPITMSLSDDGHVDCLRADVFAAKSVVTADLNTPKISSAKKRGRPRKSSPQMLPNSKKLRSNDDEHALHDNVANAEYDSKVATSPRNAANLISHRSRKSLDPKQNTQEDDHRVFNSAEKKTKTRKRSVSESYKSPKVSKLVDTPVVPLKTKVTSTGKRSVGRKATVSSARKASSSERTPVMVSSLAVGDNSFVDYKTPELQFDDSAVQHTPYRTPARSAKRRTKLQLTPYNLPVLSKTDAEHSIAYQDDKPEELPTAGDGSHVGPKRTWCTVM